MKTPQYGDKLAPHLPQAETEHLTQVYRDAKVILEYGSGGSTRIGASLPGKYVISVESDVKWARNLQHELDRKAPASPVVVYHADLGETGRWGRPINEDNWRWFFRYPLNIWDEPFFRHPDVVLIDGRLRTACLAITMLRCTKPVTVLFDDYAVRPLYHNVEKFIRPTKMIGRMAHFDVEPGMVDNSNIAGLLKQFTLAGAQGTRESFYQETEFDSLI